MHRHPTLRLQKLQFLVRRQGGSSVSISGGALPVDAEAVNEGLSAILPLIPHQENRLIFTAIAYDSRESGPTLVSILQDSIPPSLVIDSPSEGYGN